MIVPIIENGDVVAHVFFGQLLDDTSISDQWDITKKSVQAFPKIEELKDAFFRLKDFQWTISIPLTNLWRHALLTSFYSK